MQRVHDSSTLKAKFEKLVDQDDKLREGRHSLTRHVPMRWNSNLACLSAHIHFRRAIEQLTAASSNKLQAYRLTDQQ